MRTRTKIRNFMFGLNYDKIDGVKTSLVMKSCLFGKIWYYVKK